MKVFLKLSFIVALIAVIFYGSAHKSWLRISYEINKLEIIEKFCINKEETTFTCDGKCHLKTELAKADPENESPFHRSTVEDELTLFRISFEGRNSHNHQSESVCHKPYQKNYSFLYGSKLYRPPCA